MTAEFLRGKLGGDADIETLEIRTSGDKRQDWSLEKYGGKGLFTKEIEEALIAATPIWRFTARRICQPKCPNSSP